MALSYEVHVAPPVRTADTSFAPGESERSWSPISSTLISGERDAVLVDTPLTREQTGGLLDWLAASGKNLTTVYLTHGHGDHWFGLGMVLARYPQARAVTSPEVIDVMRANLAPGFLDGFWRQSFPDQIPTDLVMAEPLDGDRLTLEGEELVAVPLGHTDTDRTTCLHAPSIGLVVAGDAAYNDVHQYVAESDERGRLDWMAAIDVMESLEPQAVVAGHKRDGRPDDPHILAETRQYLLDFDAVAEQTTTPEELYEEMLAIYPDRVNPGALWTSAVAQKPQ
jgi:glyoxylase-like metal-dependent hydrolase (beta-lactamase superfamily II)